MSQHFMEILFLINYQIKKLTINKIISWILSFILHWPRSKTNEFFFIKTIILIVLANDTF